MYTLSMYTQSKSAVSETQSQASYDTIVNPRMTPVQQVSVMVRKCLVCNLRATRGACYSRSSSALLEERAEDAAEHVRDMTILRIIAVRSSSSEMTEGEKVFLARSKKKLRES